jgi:hypothetical protein
VNLRNTSIQVEINPSLYSNSTIKQKQKLAGAIGATTISTGL